jgi:hypothetical protein
VEQMVPHLWCGTLWCLIITYFISTASASVPVKQFNLGDFHTYSYESTVLLNEAKSSINSAYAKDVGYQISAQIQVASVWQNSFDPAEKILQIQVSIAILLLLLFFLIIKKKLYKTILLLFLCKIIFRFYNILQTLLN